MPGQCSLRTETLLLQLVLLLVLPKFCKIVSRAKFLENVLDSFSCFTLKLPIQSLLSVVPTRSVFWLATQYQQNEHTPETVKRLNISNFCV